MNFWDNKLNGNRTPAAVPGIPDPVVPVRRTPAQQERPWWMAPEAIQAAQVPDVSQYVPGRDGPPIEELARMDASTLSQEALEMIAAYKLKTKDKYNNACPHCGAVNGLFKASRSVAPRCVECGYSERNVHEELQPLSKIRPGKDVLHARDFTGGNVGDQGYLHHSQGVYQTEFGGPAR